MRHTRRRGSNAAIVGLSVFVTSGFSAMAVDVGFLRVGHAQLQAVTDVSAQSAAWFLNGTQEGIVNATAEAHAMARRNEVWGDPVILGTSDVVIGQWNPDQREFIPTQDPARANAVAVQASTGHLATFFAGLAFGTESLSAGARSIGVARSIVPTPASVVDCYIPLALPSCILDRNTPEQIQDINFVLNPAGGDNTGWARVGNEQPSASYATDQIQDCMSAGQASITDEISLNNGVMTTALGAMARRVDESTTAWNADVWGPLPSQLSGSAVHNYGNTYEAPILLFDGGEDFCNGGGSWNSSGMQIVGFAWAAIYDVKKSGAVETEKNIRMRVDLSTERVFGSRGFNDVDTSLLAPPGGSSYLVY